MLVKVKCISFRGITPVEVTVEVYVNNRGLPSFDIVGLADKSVEESKQRVKTAFLSSNYDFRDKKITVNLAPADLHKEGTYYDLPIAVGIFCAQKNIKISEDALFFGELSLDGSLRSTARTFLLGLFAKETGFRRIYIPSPNVTEASMLNGVEVIGISNLDDLFKHLQYGSNIATKYDKARVQDKSVPASIENTLDSIQGQVQAKRALVISAAGGHNLLLTGTPGTGKTMLAKALPEILSDLSEEESLEVTKIYSYIGELNQEEPLIKRRPFRSPHHTSSFAGVIGGGNPISPGEITKAHRGILFLDEMPEFSRNILEALRQPVQDGYINLTRSRTTASFPASFMLVGACNPCPCGYSGHPTKECVCSAAKISWYKRRLSGPILDRIDLFAKTVPLSDKEVLEFTKCLSDGTGQDQSRALVTEARKIQAKRFSKIGIYTNAEMTNSHIKHFCTMDSQAEILLHQAMERFALSPRSYFKIIKIAKTIADLEHNALITSAHIAEALQYRDR
ncbi:hypothetical protein A2415_02330 [candidate division WWE3 bacterium RIFOXYC1_FULL_39_7]|uniref:AAA+ ATPase domain-containing protein n=2 Tax=Katanobacteria TaxID=422282 RepID=A0A1F4X5V5_UNCKA|nr:MAG: hypothetical protein A2415_02330 [candidate division WWE3 bacterium RIFOXYC1_FULL_39_7]OGC77054.1 MAG: hypothetical protein A2619_01505 [candidate division WWE3 bacterium RIFOXYD1_FULL_39_9]